MRIRPPCSTLKSKAVFCSLSASSCHSAVLCSLFTGACVCRLPPCRLLSHFGSQTSFIPSQAALFMSCMSVPFDWPLGSHAQILRLLLVLGVFAFSASCSLGEDSCNASLAPLPPGSCLCGVPGFASLLVC